MINAFRFAQDLFSSRSKKTWGTFTEVSEISHFDPVTLISWTQAGEEIAPLNVFNLKKYGNYVEIGAHHPVDF